MEQEAELQRLRDENADLKKRIANVANVESVKKKLEVKVEQLERKVSSVQLVNYCHTDTTTQMETTIQEKVSQKANELTATYDEKFRNYEDRSNRLCLFV